MAEDTKKIIYSMMQVSKHRNNKPILKDISLSYFYGAKIGVLGLNGSGKSTLLRILAGVDTDYTGETTISKGFNVGYLEQEPKLDPEKTVIEIVQEGMQEAVNLLKEYEEISEKFEHDISPEEMDELLEKQGNIQEKIDDMDAWDVDSKLDMAMDALRCPPADQKIGTLSGGEKRRVALCRLLLIKPEILLLDEPTNHLDAETVAWLEHHLQAYKGTVIAVTHDRYFLDNVAGWILELDRGQGIPWKGNYSSWLEQKENRMANEDRNESERQKALKKELEWIKATPKGRQSKSKARITQYESLLELSGEKQAKELQLYIPAGPRLGNTVIEINNIKKSFGDKMLFEDLSFKIPAGGIVGIIGPNGAGKTTLFKMIAGKETPDDGDIKIGKTVKLGHVDQERETLNDEDTIWEAISEKAEQIQLGNYSMNSRAYLSRFNFTGSDQQKQIKVLSGGEKNRVNMAKMFKNGSNVMLLDEPTNDLDVNTLRALEEGLVNFAGCAVIISHDRWFLNRVATHILAFEGDSEVIWFEGNYSDYDTYRKEVLKKSEVPTRIKYRHLTR